MSGRPGAVYPRTIPVTSSVARVAESEVRFRSEPARLAAPQAEPAAIEQLADMLAGAERPLVLFGKGAAWADASEPLRALVDRGIPYVAAPMSRGTLPDDHPNFVNGARSAALKGADAILMIGGRFNWIFSFGSPARFAPGCRIAQIDVSAEELYSGGGARARHRGGRPRRPPASSWRPSTAASSRARAARGSRTSPRRATENDGRRCGRERSRAPCRSTRTGSSPELARDAAAQREHRGSTAETTMGIARPILPSFEPRHRFNSGTTGCMVTGVPYAIGAKLARPDEPSVAVVGDYAFGSAMMDVETAARIGANVVFVVCNNEGIAGHMLQDHFFPEGAPKVASLLPAAYEKLAEMVDGHAERVEAPDDIRPAVERALAADRLAVVHVLMDPKVTRMSGGVYLR